MSCKIIVNNPGIIGAGDSISGKVVCTFDNEESIRGIRCNLRGQERTHWTQRRGKHNVHYAGKNNFITADTTCVGEVVMNPGLYEYPFTFMLAQSHIPSSYSHQFGSVRYFIQANVDRPFAFDYRDEVTLHVEAPITLINQDSQSVPVTLEVEKETHTCCCSTGRVIMNVTLEKNNYALGEVVNFKVRLNNGTGINIEQLEVQIASNIQYVTHSPSTRYKMEKYIISGGNSAGVNAHDQKDYKLSLKIPPETIIPNFSNCLLFKQWFTVNVEAVFPPFHRNLICQSNITIGHVGFGINVRPSSVHTVNPGIGFPDAAPSAPTLFGNDDAVYLDSRTAISQAPPSYDDVMKNQAS